MVSILPKYVTSAVHTTVSCCFAVRFPRRVFSLICTCPLKNRIETNKLWQEEEDPAVAAQRAERERMAAMLFGGTGARSTPTAAPSLSSAPGTGGLRPKITSSGFRSSAAAASAAPTTSPAPAARTTQSSAGSPPPVDLLDFSTLEGPAGGDDGATTRVDGGGGSSPVDLLGVGGGRMEDSGAVSSSSPGGVSTNATNGSASAGASPQLSAVVVDDLLGGGYSASNGSGGNMRRVSNGGSIANHGTRAGSLGAGSPPSGPSTTIPLGGSVPGLDLSGLFHGGTPAGGGDFSFGGRVVKPLMIATEEFGKKWMACSGERRAGKLPLGSGLRSPNAAVEKLVTRLGVHKVEIISQTAEGICAGHLEGGGGSGSVCLVHCKVGSDLFVCLVNQLKTRSFGPFDWSATIVNSTLPPHQRCSRSTVGRFNIFCRPAPVCATFEGVADTRDCRHHRPRRRRQACRSRLIVRQIGLGTIGR